MSADALIIQGWFDDDLIDTAAVGGLTSRPALVLVAGVWRQILPAEVGTGMKPIVQLTSGAWAQRVTTEGVPLIIVNGQPRALNPATETLLL